MIYALPITKTVVDNIQGSHNRTSARLVKGCLVIQINHRAAFLKLYFYLSASNASGATYITLQMTSTLEHPFCKSVIAQTSSRMYTILSNGFSKVSRKEMIRYYDSSHEGFFDFGISAIFWKKMPSTKHFLNIFMNIFVLF